MNDCDVMVILGVRRLVGALASGGSAPRSRHRFTEITALLVIDPYNDFISERRST